MKKRKNNENLTRGFLGAEIRQIEGEGNEHRFTLSFSSEEPYERWFGTEILSHKEEAVDLTRLNSIGVLLYNHNRDKVIGKVIKAWLEDGRGLAEIEFDKDEESQTICDKVTGGSLKGVSVGYQVREWEDVKPNKRSSDGKFTGPCNIATKWMPFEISIVSIPADSTVGVDRDMEDVNGFEERDNREVSGSYFNEKQLQINNNILTGGSN